MGACVTLLSSEYVCLAKESQIKPHQTKAELFASVHMV